MNIMIMWMKEWVELYTFCKTRASTLTVKRIFSGIQNPLQIFSSVAIGDILAAQNHSEAIQLVRKMAFDSTYQITEEDIKKIHRIVMKGVITSAGEYRDYDLEVREAGFTPPPFYEISENMKEFIDMLNNNSDELHPIEFAAQVHYDFVWIHPFEDGNGRMARLLLNLVLVKSGYPFAVIQSVDKKRYLKTLRQMDLEREFEPFLIYIARCVEQTLDIYLNSDSKESKEKLLSLSELAENTPPLSRLLESACQKRTNRCHKGRQNLEDH